MLTTNYVIMKFKKKLYKLKMGLEPKTSKKLTCYYIIDK